MSASPQGRGWAESFGEERPADTGKLQWIWRGVERQGVAAVVALLVCWGNLWLGILLAVAGALGGGLLAVAAGFGPFSFIAGALPDWMLETAAAGSFVAGAGLGALYGLGAGILGPAAILGTAGGIGLGAVLGHLLFGVVLAAVILAVWMYAEDLVLRIAYGARRMSDREAERVEPLVSEIGSRMGLSSIPQVKVLEKTELNGYAHLHRLSLTRMYLNHLGDEELAGILAHEIHHWRRADGVGLAVVKAVSAPIILAYDALWFVAGLHQVAGLLAFLLLWPVWVAVRLIIIPVMGVYQRRYEYEADAAAVDAGYGEALHRALEELQDIEPGRDGFERSLASTHPPTELRLEAIRHRMERWARSGEQERPEPLR